jgi:hypothetical protein
MSDAARSDGAGACAAAQRGRGTAQAAGCPSSGQPGALLGHYWGIRLPPLRGAACVPPERESRLQSPTAESQRVFDIYRWLNACSKRIRPPMPRGATLCVRLGCSLEGCH